MGKRSKKGGRGGGGNKGNKSKGAGKGKNRQSPKGSPAAAAAADNKNHEAAAAAATATADATAAAVVSSHVEAATISTTPQAAAAEAAEAAAASPSTNAAGENGGSSSSEKTPPPPPMTTTDDDNTKPAPASKIVPENGSEQEEKTVDNDVPVQTSSSETGTGVDTGNKEEEEAAFAAASVLDAVLDATVPDDSKKNHTATTSEETVVVKDDVVDAVVVQDEKVQKVQPQEEEEAKSSPGVEDSTKEKTDDVASPAAEAAAVVHAAEEATPPTMTEEAQDVAKETSMSTAAQGPLLVDDVIVAPAARQTAAGAKRKETISNGGDHTATTASTPTASPAAAKSSTSSSSSYEAMIETPSPSNVKDLKSKLWDNNMGLQVRVRPSVPADLQSSTQQRLAPVPSPFKPNAVAAAAAAAASSSSSAGLDVDKLKDTLPSSPPISVKEKAASLVQGSREVAPPSAVIERSKVSEDQPAPATSTSKAAAPAAPSSDVVPVVATSTDATGLSANNSGKRLARRKGPTSPKSILDRKALIQALDDGGISYKDVHITAFYQALHRQQYPDLPIFVENFYKHENKQDLPTLQGPSAQSTVSQTKNRNKMQLPKAFLQFLANPDNGFVTITSKVAEAKTSQDKSTTKLAIELHDGQMVESVLMRYNKYSKETHRASLCISSQCGCAMGCTFCATGMMGLSGNLTTAEILEQIVHADRILAKEWSEKQAQQQDEPAKGEVKQLPKKKEQPLDSVRNVVFMGMGEPLDNYTNVVEACRALMDRKRWNLAHGRVTVSTVGVVSQMRKLSQDLPHVNLALSLHAPNQEMRVKIVPSAARYPIEELIDALDGHMKAYLSSTERMEHSNRKRNGGKKDAAVDSVDGDDDVSQDENEPENMKTGSSGSSSNADSDRTPSARRRAMVEYIMLDGETSTTASAHELGKLCQDKNLVVNLIPYNATNVKDPLKCPSKDDMAQFRDIVSSYKVFCTIRRTMGSDIDSACGQLITLQQKESDIEDSSPGTCRSRSTGKPGNGTASTTSTNARTTTASRATDSSKKGSDKKKKDDDDFDKYITPLAIVTGLVATCFVASVVLRRRR